jgi:hypothetical protein
MHPRQALIAEARRARIRAKVKAARWKWLQSEYFSIPWLLALGVLGLGVQFANPMSEAFAARAPESEIVQRKPVDEAEVRLLAATAWAEARSEGEAGMRAVAHVIVNRIGPRFGGDVHSVVRSPWQFSAWNRGDPNLPLAQNPERYARGGINKTSWERAKAIAREVLEGRSSDPTRGALFYHTRAVKPYWSRYGVGTQVIGQHIFYADVRNAPTRRGRRAPAPDADLINSNELAQAARTLEQSPSELPGQHEPDNGEHGGESGEAAPEPAPVEREILGGQSAA